MKRKQTAIIGIMVVLALILVVSGCTSSNPVSPAISDTENDRHYSPGSEAILIEPVINSDLLDDEIMVGEAAEKLLPGITEYPMDDPPVINPGDRVPDVDFHDEADITR